MNKTRTTKREAETVLITGGARGLGFVFAHLYAKRGAKVAICSRTPEELESGKRLLLDRQPEAVVETYVCDVGDQAEVDRMVDEVERRFGPIDILVNNAGVIQSAPLELVSEQDLQDSIHSNLWGTVRTSLAIVPSMLRRRSGKVLNVTSIGGVIPTPHLLSYCTSKFGAVGFSASLAVEARRFGVTVTTATPTLMNTGGFMHAWFKGRKKIEMGLFAWMDTTPLLSKSAVSAAQEMVRACDRGVPFVAVGLNAKLARIAFGLFPNFTIRALSLMSRLLPAPKGPQDAIPETGAQIERRTGIHPQTRAGDLAVKRWNESRAHT